MRYFLVYYLHNIDRYIFKGVRQMVRVFVCGRIQIGLQFYYFSIGSLAGVRFGIYTLFELEFLREKVVLFLKTQI